MAFGGIGLVIALMLGSFLEAVFVVSIIPFAIAGVILAFFLHGQPLSMFAMMGSIRQATTIPDSILFNCLLQNCKNTRVASSEMT